LRDFFDDRLRLDDFLRDRLDRLDFRDRLDFLDDRLRDFLRARLQILLIFTANFLDFLHLSLYTTGPYPYFPLPLKNA
jgi:hypothetical protein